MKKLFLSICLIFSGLGLFAQLNTYFVDFGPNDTTNGNITPSPDINNHYWNNVTDPSTSSSPVNLVNSSNQTGSAYIQVTQSFLRNGRNHGGLLAPSAASLGDFAIGTATEDYFFVTNTGALEIGGLAPGKGFVFSFFGTRNTSATRITSYDLAGSNNFSGNLQTSGSGIGGGSYNGNNSTILISDTVHADANGKINLTIAVVQGGFAYLGCMKMEEVQATPPAPQPTLSFLVDLGPNDVTNGNITPNPDKNGNSWNNLTENGASASPVQLIDIDGNQTNAEVSILGDFQKNGIQNGALLNPVDSLLGEFAIPTATQDYFFSVGTSTLAIDNLDPNKAYQFSLFGSRNTTIVRESEYTLTGNESITDTLQTSGPDIGGNGYNGNNSTILKMEAIRPDANGRITLKMAVAAGGFAYLNTMRIDEIAIKPAFYVDLGPDDGTNGNQTTSPDPNGIYWNNMTNPSAAGDSVVLVNGDNKPSKAYLKVTQDFQANGILNGGLLNPADSLLGELAVATATQDYFFTSTSASLQIGGLDTTKGYVFSLFGTRSTTNTRISRFSFTGDGIFTDSLKTSGAGIGANNYDGNNNSVLVTDTIRADVDGNISIDLEVAQGGFAYLGLMKIEEVVIPKPAEPLCPQRDSLLIAVMGSSVADGFGAMNSQGYAYQYTQLLQDRFSNGQGRDWSVSNISIGGNSTVSLLNRWDSDLAPLCSRYVIYGLSLGNEGIRSQGQAAFDRFRDNMLILIDEARKNGIEPIVVNCYARADFDSVDYRFTKDMNLLIHDWDVASINSLGAVDDLTGKWATGYEADPFHPNTAGHREMFYTIVPSLFDALDQGKKQPQKIDSTFIQLDKSNMDELIEFTPDDIVHPFTYAFEVRTSGMGSIAAFSHDNGGYGGLTIDANGSLAYISTTSNGIAGSSVINDNNWHHVALTHYFALGKTLLFVDGQLEGEVAEQLEVDKFVLSEKGGPTADFKELLFYRAGMTPDEIMAIANGDLLKSSLEVYAPLDGEAKLGADPLVNLAQSTVTLDQVMAYSITSIDESVEGLLRPLQIYPNPSQGVAHFDFTLAKKADVKLSIFDITGRELARLADDSMLAGSHHLSWEHQQGQAQLVLCVLQLNGKSSTHKLLIK